MAECADKDNAPLLDENQKAAQEFMDILNQLLAAAEKLAERILQRGNADRGLMANAAEVLREANEVVDKFGPFAQSVADLAEESFNVGYATAIKLANRPDLLKLVPEAEKAAVMIEARLILSEGRGE